MLFRISARLRQAWTCSRPLGVLRRAAAFGAVALVAMMPSVASAMSPGCEVMNSGRYTRTTTSNYHLSDDARFVRGDVVTLQYTRTFGTGTLQFHVGSVVQTANDSAGTLTVNVAAAMRGSFLTSTWQGNYSTVASCTPGPDVPVVRDQTVEVEPNSGDVTIYLGHDWQAAAPTSFRIDPPSHGTATLNGFEVVYSPDAGFTGLDTFQFVGVNADGDSEPATVRIRIATALDMSPADESVLPQATIDQPYSVQFTGLNCVGACTFKLSDTTFNDGEVSIDPATGVLSGTPTSFNIYSGEPEHQIQVYLSDASDASTPFNFTIPIVESSVPSASGSTTTIPANTSDQRLDLVLAKAPRGVEITRQPAHGSAWFDGLNIYYTPNLNFMGTDQLTFVATNNMGSSAPAIATIVVERAQSGQIYPASGPLPRALVDEAYSQQIEIIDQTATFTHSGTLPPGLTLNGATGLLSGTPTAEGAGQTYSFSVTGQGSDPWDSPQTADYTMEIAQGGVTATDKVIEVVPGTAPLPVDLTAGATGGPFTDAAILAVEPPDAGTAKLTMGELASVDPDWVPGTFYLKFIPNPNFKGTAVVRYALRGSAGVSNNASVTFTVPLGVAAIANQVDGQVKGFIASRQSQIAAMVDHPGLVDRRRAANGQQPGVLEIMPSARGLALNFATSQSELKAWNEAGNAAGALASTSAPDPFNAWINGTVALHLRNDASLEYTGSFALLSLGADYLVNDQLMAGLALHIDTMDDRSGITRTDGKGFLVGPYVSAELGAGVFLDASLLYGRSWNDVSNGYFSGVFETDRLLGKAQLEGAWALGENLTLRPDATLALSHEIVGDYTITNGLGDEITIAGFGSTQVRLSAGGTLEFRLLLENGLILTPELSGSVGYSTTSASRLGGAMFGTLGTGLSLVGNGGWSFGTTIDVELDSNGARGARARSSLSAHF